MTSTGNASHRTRALCLGVVLLTLLGSCAQLAVASPDAHSNVAVHPNGNLVCHNSTGTCLASGFHCANKQVVPFSKRCNGVDDCMDGTDEYLCNIDGSIPLHLRSQEERHAIEQDSSCGYCGCGVAVTIIVEGDPWWSAAKQAPTDTIGLMTGTGAHAGQPCYENCVRQIKLAYYKKSYYCRGALCCIRQRECVQCIDPAVVGSCTGTSVANRCYTS